MLVLTRKPGDRIVIGDDIVITVLESRGDGVRIGISAPAGVAIHRAELRDAIAAETASAAEAASQVSDADAARAIAGAANAAPAPRDEATEGPGASPAQAG